MSVSAHPDDEDGAALAYYARVKGVKTYTLFLTRGEGGQNEIGPQLYGELGAIRTKETLNAARILGSESYFLGFPDFGYSRTAAETFARWGGKDSVVARMVYYIRALQPDVIFSSHDTVTTKPGRAHGNHQAAGISIFEAFAKAADPAYHREQLQGGIRPWQAKKLYFRFYLRDSLTRKGPFVIINPRGAANRDMTIDSVALAALRQHHSQGMGNWTLDSIPTFFRYHKYYLVRQSNGLPEDSTDFFAGIAPSPHPEPKVSSFKNVEFAEPHARNVSEIRAAILPGRRIALVESYDTTIPTLLDSFHIAYTLLDSARLATDALSQYTTVILDLRAYRFRSDLDQMNDRIFGYIRSGGNVTCLYHKLGDWNGKNLSPLKLTLTGDRVTEEDAPVTVLDRMHRFFNTPNLITDADWDGWVQERSIYLPSNDTSLTSAGYERLLAMSDTGEDQPTTSLLWAKYEKGTYTYCSLALYRQLRFRHEGAVKLFFNMLSQP